MPRGSRANRIFHWNTIIGCDGLSVTGIGTHVATHDQGGVEAAKEQRGQDGSTPLPRHRTATWGLKGDIETQLTSFPTEGLVRPSELTAQASLREI